MEMKRQQQRSTKITAQASCGFALTRSDGAAIVLDTLDGSSQRSKSTR